MLPNIDPATTSASVGTNSPVRRPEVDKALEAYKATQNREPVSYEQAGEARKATEVLRKSQNLQVKSESGVAARPQDKAEINFQLSREEREVFVNAVSGREDPSEMTEQEQRILERTAERIEKMLEAAAARDADGRERLDKAVKEWYTKLSNGQKSPEDLIYLIRKYALGDLTFLRPS